jgi:hypothetical protein
MASIIRVTRIGESGTKLTALKRASVTRNVPSLPNLSTLMIDAINFSEASGLARATLRHTPEDGILHSHRRENFKSYIALTGWALQQRRHVSPVRYDLGFYFPENAILHSHRREILKSYIGIDRLGSVAET